MASPVSAIFWPTSFAVVWAWTGSGAERSRTAAATMAEITLWGMDILLAGVFTTLDPSDNQAAPRVTTGRTSRPVGERLLRGPALGVRRRVLRDSRVDLIPALR